MPALIRGFRQPSVDERVEVRNGDELEQLADAFNSMSRQLAESRVQTQNAQLTLEQARDHLERSVAERTHNLVEVNDRLRHEVAERVRAQEMLARAARSDPLTGLMNRRAMLEHMEYQAARFQRSRMPFTLMLADLDHFKGINDTYGHDVGDQVLVRVAQRLTDSIRSQDLVARWGGEEFLILLPDTDLAGGLVVAEKVRASLPAEAFFPEQHNLQLTLSIGVTAYMPGQTLSQCIKAADMALYQAKRQGRNRVVAAEDREHSL